MADPLDVLHQPEAPMAPSPAFAAQLRRRLGDLLGVPSATPAAAGRALHLRPYLVVARADDAIAFYTEVFGARVVGDLIRGDDGRVGHCELEIGGDGLYLADAYPEYGIPAPDPAVGVSLHLEVADADATVRRAVDRGAQVLQPVEDRFYGSRSGTVQDPFGHRWQIDAPGTATPDEDRMVEDGFRYETVDLGDRAPAPGDAATTGGEGFGLGYFTIDAPDPDRANAFYTALLGWETHPSGQGHHIANVAPPGGIDQAAGEPGVTVFFRVPDVAAAAARVRELGGTVLEEAIHPSGGNARCLDDQGVPFQLWQPAPGY